MTVGWVIRAGDNLTKQKGQRRTRIMRKTDEEG